MRYYNCACCGKQFVVHEAWGYAYAGLYTCSYHCMRQMRREDLEGKVMEKPMARTLTHEDRVRIVEMHDAGMKNSEIAEKLDLKLMQVATFLGRRNKAAEKAPETVEKCTETVEKCVETIEKCTETAKNAQTEHVDPVRLINAICDALQLLRVLYERQQ